MVPLNEDFKPAKKYTGYLLIATIAASILLWAVCAFWLFIPDQEPIFEIFKIIAVIAIAVIVVFIFVWAPLYFKSVVYHLSGTEMTWKRGVWFRKTGIVPYNRITNVDIVQGPVMRLFGISHLKIETAGGSSGKSSAEIQIEGIEDPEPLRQVIMDFVRGRAPSPAATGTEYGRRETPDMQALIEDVAAIRKLLEERK